MKKTTTRKYTRKEDAAALQAAGVTNPRTGAVSTRGGKRRKAQAVDGLDPVSMRTVVASNPFDDDQQLVTPSQMHHYSHQQPQHLHQPHHPMSHLPPHHPHHAPMGPQMGHPPPPHHSPVPLTNVRFQQQQQQPPPPHHPALGAPGQVPIDHMHPHHVPPHPHPHHQGPPPHHHHQMPPNHQMYGPPSHMADSPGPMRVTPLPPQQQHMSMAPLGAMSSPPQMQPIPDGVHARPPMMGSPTPPRQPIYHTFGPTSGAPPPPPPAMGLYGMPSPTPPPPPQAMAGPPATSQLYGPPPSSDGSPSYHQLEPSMQSQQPPPPPQTMAAPTQGSPPRQQQQKVPPNHMTNTPFPSSSSPQQAPMGMQHQQQIYCLECRQPIYGNEARIMCRAGCEAYYHRHCSGLTEMACELLLREPAAEWACNRCICSDRRIPVVRMHHSNNNQSHHELHNDCRQSVWS